MDPDYEPEHDPESDDAAEWVFHPGPFDPVVQRVDVVVYTLIIGTPVLIMQFLGAAWVWLCFVCLGLAAWKSTDIAQWLVDRLRRWLGRPSA